jgi:hypothetical protein
VAAEKDNIFGAARNFFLPSYFVMALVKFSIMERLIYRDYVIFGSEKFLFPQSMY